MRRWLLVLLAAVILVPGASGTSANIPGLAPSVDAGQGGQGRGGGAGGGRAPAIADRTAGMQKLDGFMPLYWDEGSGTLFMEIGRWNQEMIYLAGLSTGLGSNDIGLERAQIGGTRIVKFTRIGPKVLMTEPNYDYRADSPDAAERKAVEDAFATSVLWGFTVAAETDGRVLVDLSDLIMRDSYGLAGRLGAGYRFDRTRSAVHMPGTKSFPKNTEIDVISTMITDGGGGRGGGGGGAAPAGGRGGGPQQGGTIGDVAPSTEAVTMRQHHSFVELPDNNYKTRVADPRSGYGSRSYLNFSAPFGQDVRVRFIGRHRLEKKDPSAARSEAVKPIIYYVDRGTPEPIRTALITGASWWNQAFEAAGFINAFKVEMMPEGADPLDVRYNTITWVHRSTRGWSTGGSVSDPRTGEIIKGHVTLGSLRAQQDYLIGEGLMSPYTSGTEKPQVLTDMVLNRLRQLSAHEVGHTIGLGHNYYNSKTGRTSVMDYPHPLINLKKDGTLDFADVYTNSIGEWDKVAVRYGYGVYPAATEAADLKRVLDEAWDKDIRYMTNQDSDLHPGVDAWNNGSDAAAELERIMSIRRAGMERFGETAIQTGMPMAMMEEVLVPLYLHHRYAVESAASTIAGQNYIYAMRGDGRQPVEWATPAQQKAALDALMKTLRPGELALSRSVLAKLPPRPPGYGRHRELFPRYTGGAFDPIIPAIVAADMTVGFILTNDRAARMVAQKAVDPAMPGLAEVIDRIVATTFDAAAPSAYEAEIKRGILEVVVGRLIDLADTAPMAQVRAIASQKLKAIQARPAAVNAADRAMLEMLSADIKRFFERPNQPARVIASPGTPPGAPIGDYGMNYLEGLLSPCIVRDR